MVGTSADSDGSADTGAALTSMSIRGVSSSGRGTEAAVSAMAVSSASASGARMRAVGAFTMVDVCVWYAGWRGVELRWDGGRIDSVALTVLGFDGLLSLSL